MYRLIASDLDETLLDHNGSISEENLLAIQEAKKLGVYFVPATGRGFRSVDKTLKELGVYDKQDEYVISFNGGAITENKDYKVLDIRGLSYEKVSELFETGRRYNVCIHVYTRDIVYVYNINDSEREYLGKRCQWQPIGEDISFLKDERLVKIIFENTDMNYLHFVEEEMKDVIAGLDVVYSSNRYLEFNQTGVNKGTGLQRLCEILHIDIKDTIAVGDSTNDMAMLQAAGLSCAVNNAVPQIKELCDYVCKQTSNEAPIAEIIHEFIIKG
ncbi:MAG: HAD family phosphatase [Erysipelotrichaceae bacterium]|nr:HAD family phosphatase [Erysipelotrichaceae bacterium]